MALAGVRTVITVINGNQIQNESVLSDGFSVFTFTAACLSIPLIAFPFKPPSTVYIYSVACIALPTLFAGLLKSWVSTNNSNHSSSSPHLNWSHWEKIIGGKITFFIILICSLMIANFTDTTSLCILQRLFS